MEWKIIFTQKRTPFVDRRQNVVVRAERHEQRERHHPDAEREIRQDFGELEPVRREEPEGQPVIDDQHHDRRDKRSRQKLNERKVLHDDRVQNLGRQSADHHRIRDTIEDGQQHVDDGRQANQPGDGLLGGHRVLLEQFRQVVESGSYMGLGYF